MSVVDRNSGQLGSGTHGSPRIRWAINLRAACVPAGRSPCHSGLVSGRHYYDGTKRGNVTRKYDRWVKSNREYKENREVCYNAALLFPKKEGYQADEHTCRQEHAAARAGDYGARGLVSYAADDRVRHQ